MEKYIKIGLAILLFLCLTKMPYGYYQLVRIVSLIGFSLLAYYSYLKGNIPGLIIYIGLVLLFQPFLKIALGKVMWNFVDIIIGLGLILSLFSIRKSEK